jgi:hypothetical protein
LLRQEPLAVALVPLDEEGTTHEVWQVAAWELQPIMQLVVVELCARRIDLLAEAADALVADTPIANTVIMIRKPRKSASSATRMSGQNNAIVAAAKCADPRGCATGSLCEAASYAVRM